MNVKKYCTVACVVVSFPLLHISGLGITDMPNDPYLISAGLELMSALNVPEGDENLSFSCWSYPTSIVIRTVPYHVDVGWRESGCKVYATNDMTHPLADVYVLRMPNEKKARLFKIGSIARNCSLPRISLVRQLSVEYLDSTTNTLFVSWKKKDHDLDGTLISKNLMMTIRGYTNIVDFADVSTNAVDFAVAILNAGLPENERISVTPE